jgi:heme/copper-type cytochrome/quinol oxidase subunit 1
MFAAIPFDQQLTDTYFVVAHFHYVIFGAAVFPLLGGMYYWFPKVTGKMYYERWGQASFWLTFVGMNVTFFPMHILGLDGMPRRDYTYSPGLGWTGLNLIETLGSYALALGLAMVAGNLIVSLFRGEPAGDDPFGGDTLEWSISSPPPEYNFAVIPTVSSPYANWDEDDRRHDKEKLEQGVQVLERGHETSASTVVDGEWDEVLEMPSSSPWPPLLALALAGIFAMVILKLWLAAAFFAALVLLVLAAWHGKEPQEA